MKIVLKYGGNAMGPAADAALIWEIALLRAAGHVFIIVHGGGPEIDEELLRRGLDAPRIEGLRVTDLDVLGVAESVLCGTANKRLVRSCLQNNIPAVGISGQDAGQIRVTRAVSASGGDLGFVGEIASVDPSLLMWLSDAGYVPVVSSMAVDEQAEHAYNVNADSVAGAVAAAVNADAYIVITNVRRVLRDPADASTGIDSLTVAAALDFANSKACADGMKPKMLAAVAAVTGGASRAYICAAKPDAISSALAGDATTIG